MPTDTLYRDLRERLERAIQRGRDAERALQLVEVLELVERGPVARPADRIEVGQAEPAGR